MKNNAYIRTVDAGVLGVYTAEEATELFGEDHLEEFGSRIPDDLLKRYLANQAEFEAIQKELQSYDKKD